VYFIFNAHWEPLEFELPARGEERGNPWKRWIDTFLDPPEDIVPWQNASSVSGQTYPAGARSVVVLWASLGVTGRVLYEFESICHF